MGSSNTLAQGLGGQRGLYGLIKDQQGQDNLNMGRTKQKKKNSLKEPGTCLPCQIKNNQK